MSANIMYYDSSVIELSQENLSKYFEIADASSSWYTEPTNTFDFVSRSSDTLVVTIGDSWTYGATLKSNDRQKNVYGNHLSNMLNADWLNLGLPASGNFWLVEKVEELSRIIQYLPYKKFIVICVFTGVGRWFDTRYDTYIKYTQWFDEYIGDDFEKLLSMLNQECARRILDATNKIPNLTLKIGTNFVEHVGFDTLPRECILPSPWYSLLVDDNETVYNCSYYGRFKHSLNFMDKKHHNNFKQWYINLYEKTEHRINVLNKSDYFDSGHPLEYGHKQWAEYVFGEIE